jgi:cytidylate kinase
MTPGSVVTIAALYGTGGAIIGPRVAERLGVEFLDRAIPASVAEQAGLTEKAVATVDEGPRRRTERLISHLARASNPATATGMSVEHVYLDERKIRGEIEEFLVRASRSGGVMLGRGGAVVLRDVPGALHVHLGGPRGARVEQTMEHEGVDRGTAERRVDANDRARMAYVRDAYGVDGEDSKLYHLMIDATAFDVDACVDLIVTACRKRTTDA